jgi:hypothetical protein
VGNGTRDVLRECNALWAQLSTTNAFGTAIENGSCINHQPELTTRCPGWPLARVGVRQELDKETTMIAALKQHYECYHAGDLTALKRLYEYHAENCAKAAELTEDIRQREEYLKLAREWAEAAAPLQTRTH